MTLGDSLAVANLAASFLTAGAAIYIAFVALRHTSKPRIMVVCNGPHVLATGTEFEMHFEAKNLGFWYGAPAATDVMVYPNYPAEFELRELRYGSGLEYSNQHVRPGRDGTKFIRAKHLILGRRGGVERFVVYGRTPLDRGNYVVQIDAICREGASFHGQSSLSIV